MIAVLQKEAQTGVQTGTVMRLTGEENPPGTPPMIGGEAMENETVGTTETGVRKEAFSLMLQKVTSL